MNLYHISDTLRLGETMSQDYKQNLELALPFTEALERSEDCFYAMLLSAKYLKRVLGKFGLRDMQTNYIKWATEGIFEFIRKTEFPESYSRLLSNYFYDRMEDIRRLYEVDWNMTEKEERFNFHVFQIHLEDDAPQKRDMLLFDEAFDAMWNREDLQTAITCARRYFSGGQSETPVWEILSEKPAKAVADLTGYLRDEPRREDTQ
ncbi:MAG: hypothetical protein E7459_03920 [Ruminococcaceae bacterium]|nr:hypothetical protein [Oscillospiraceae bacterium]